jgi:hypothetical protein
MKGRSGSRTTPRRAPPVQIRARPIIALDGEWQLGWRDAQIGGVDELSNQLPQAHLRADAYFGEAAAPDLGGG